METGTNAIDTSHVYRLVEIPSFLSLAFQKGKVDIVSAMHAITKTNKHLSII